MKKFLAFLIVLVMVSALILTACGESSTPASPTAAPTGTGSSPAATTPAPTQAQTQTITLNFNTQTPGPGQKANYDTDEWIVSETAKRTEGRVKIEMFYNNGLASGTAGWDATINGVTDIDESVVGYFPNQFPLTAVAELPLGYPSSFSIANAVMDLYDKYPAVQAEFEKVKLLYFACPPSFVVGTSKKEIKTNADAAGLTLRTHAGSKPIAEALGATAKITPITETYELVSKGAVDGIIVAPEAFPAYKFDEVIKHMYDVSCVTSTSASFIIVNKDMFNKLLPQDQQALVDITRTALGARAAAWDKENNTALENFLKLPGRTYNQPSEADVAELQAAMSGPTENWLQKVKADGHPGEEILQYLKDRIAYWSTQPTPTIPWESQ